MVRVEQAHSVWARRQLAGGIWNHPLVPRTEIIRAAKGRQRRVKVPGYGGGHGGRRRAFGEFGAFHFYSPLWETV
jgi:hypothetical protein